MKLISTVQFLPPYTQSGILFRLLASMNTSVINSATRMVNQDIRDMENADRHAKSTLAIDRYNELLNTLRERQVNTEWERENAPEVFEDTTNEYITNVLKMRAPLLAMFHAVQPTLPNSNGQAPADFSIEESLVRQLAREFQANVNADAKMEEGLIKAGAVTRAELDAIDQAQYAADQGFKAENMHQILDKVNDRMPDDVSTDEADDIFESMPEEYQKRLLGRLLPTLEAAKQQNIGRRGFDPDAGSNILIIGLMVKEIRKVVGESDAERKLVEMRKLLGAEEPEAPAAEAPAEVQETEAPAEVKPRIPAGKRTSSNSTFHKNEPLVKSTELVDATEST